MQKLFVSLFILISVTVKAQTGNLPPEYIQLNYKASPRPDRIMLTWNDDTKTTQTVTWRTDVSIKKAIAEIAVSDPSPDFTEKVKKYAATTFTSVVAADTAQYHSVKFTGLIPNTTYVYRVGDGRYWSEWIQFRNQAQDDSKFSFLYLGDAQNKLFFHWSRMIRAAYAKKPDAAFVLYPGDLINNAGNEYEWAEWFEAGSFIHRSMPVIATPGNHEYYKDSTGHKTGISNFWKPQFNYPQNGIKGLESTCYYIDYKNCRVISLNSNERIEEQALWLGNVLKNNKQRWIVVTFHHPVLAASKDRVNEGVYKNWKPILDKYRVDLVLQGHDHAYARGTNLNVGEQSKNEKPGTVYVISVSGPKKYELSLQDWMESSANDTQLYQVIDVEDNQITYKAYTPDNKVYDAFRIMKQSNGKINKVQSLSTEVKPRHK